MMERMIMIPLYQNNQAPRERPANGNAGLWYDKFCNQWMLDVSKSPDTPACKLVSKSENSKQPNAKSDSGKLDWIKTVTNNTVTNNPVGDSQGLNLYLQRIYDLVQALNGRAKILVTESRFVTGLGRAHPIENGFAWHQILGVPYLAGSSVKGMVRGWAGQWEGISKEIIERIFGNERQIGSVILLDAIPVAPVKLVAEIMTPHYTPYYQGEQPPGDWYSPNPIPFLAVTENQPFCFAVLPRPGAESGATDVELVLGWIEDALSWIGAGAKTSAGYGRFVVSADKETAWRKSLEQAQQEVERKKAEAAEKQRRSLMSLTEREMDAEGYNRLGDTFMNQLTSKWLLRMQDSNLEKGERLEIAQLLAQWYQEHRPDQWRKPEKKNVAKVEAIKEVLGM